MKRKREQPVPAVNAAVAYCRVSTQEQVRGGVSLDAQAERLEAYCRSAGLHLVELVREEGVSGAKPLDSRPGGKQLPSLVSWEKVQHIVALKLDRLFRDAQDARYQTRRWDGSGVALHLIDMGGQSANTASAMGRMMLTMMACRTEASGLGPAAATMRVQEVLGKLRLPSPVIFAPVSFQQVCHFPMSLLARKIRGAPAVGV